VSNAAANPSPRLADDRIVEAIARMLAAAAVRRIGEAAKLSPSKNGTATNHTPTGRVR
jgi:hypothetical protein